MLKTQVELVTGFIGAGKTAFISNLLKETAVSDEHIVVLQLEKGQEELVKETKKGADITCLTPKVDVLTVTYLSHILLLYEPDRVIIECNGTRSLDELLALFNHPMIKKKAFISTLFNLVEAPVFRVYWQNLKPLLIHALSASDMILVTKSHLIRKEDKADLKNLLENENTHGHILFTEDVAHMEQVIKTCNLLDKGWTKEMRIKFIRRLKKIQNDEGEVG
ncbi:MAG: cobalamin synthesis protein [Clostridia bacterium]|jgi:G3E family GTPase|nr:cobalamin synthesis protein [Clostridia bacterium]